jgi:hypothetical protein
MAKQLSRAHEVSDRAPFNQLLRLTGGSSPFSEFPMIFNLLNFNMQNGNLSDVQILPMFAGR